MSVEIYHIITLLLSILFILIVSSLITMRGVCNGIENI